jgi:Resolvase, N terminal domain
MVTRLDRLARSIADLQDIVLTLKARGAALRATEQPIDTSTAAGKCFLDMLVFRLIHLHPTARLARVFFARWRLNAGTAGWRCEIV